MKRVPLASLAVVLALLQGAVLGADQPVPGAAGARRVEEAKPITPGNVSSQNGTGSGSSTANQNRAASAAVYYSTEETRRILLKDAQRLFRPRNGGHAPVKEKVRPTGAANQKAAAAERTSRSLTFDVPKVKVVNDTPYFRFIRIEDTPKKTPNAP